MKALQFIYQDVEIHFLLGNDKDVMVNATEMAKAFNKRIDHFLKADHVKEFISVLEFTPFGGNSTPLTRDEIIQTKGQNGTYFHKILALKFAAWLDPIFEVWVYSTIEDILFGNYKRHWDAHIKQEQNKEEMESIKLRLISNPTTEDVFRYFQLEQVYKNCSAEKAKAIRSQYKLDLK